MEKQIIYPSPGILGLLGIVFVVLKLIGVIDWSWWIVTLPFWIPFMFILITVLTIIIIIHKNC